MKQESGENSKNIQAGRDVYYGITPTESREIALDVFKANFYDFSEKASEIALKRAEEITDEFIKDFFNSKLNQTKKLENPSVQSAFFNIQKEFAKTGDKYLKERLIYLLINRINSKERSLEQICLDEAINIIPKLTIEQINTLTFIFCTATFSDGNLTTLNKFDDFLNHLISFIPNQKITFSFFRHLTYTGCVSNIEGQKENRKLEEIFRNLYPALFVNGFTKEELQNEFGEDLIEIDRIIIACLQDNTKYQFSYLSNERFRKNYKESNLKSYLNKIINFQDKFIMKPFEIKNFAISRNNKIIDVFNIWNHEELKTIKLTSVGIAIGIINYNILCDKDLKFNKFI